MKECPYCAGPNQDSEVVCKYCGQNFPQIDIITPTISKHSEPTSVDSKLNEITPVETYKNNFVTQKPSETTPIAPMPKASIPAEPKSKKTKKRRVFLYVIGGVLALTSLCCISGLIYSATPQGKANATKVAQNKTLEALYTATVTKTPRPTKTSRPTRTAEPTETPRPTKTLRPTETPLPTNSPTPTTTPVIESSLKAIMEGTGMSQQEAELAFEIIKSVGFERVSSIEFFMEADPLKSYLADLGYTDVFLVSFTGNEVFGISNGDIVLYDRDAGGIINRITDYTLDYTEKFDFLDRADFYVEQVLKAPSTAKFATVSESQFGRDHDLVTVQSWVDAQNSFGAMLRNKIYAQFSYSTKELLYLVLGDSVVFGSLQEP
ncbi:MAG: hypothetical protein WAV05_00780 [Anaerolineales bacterium]